eukprot:13272012-Alexandrium_andersonii.AAC.1
MSFWRRPIGVISFRSTSVTHGVSRSSDLMCLKCWFKQVRLSGGSCLSSLEDAKTASGVRSLNCTGPGTTSTSLPGAPEGWIMRRMRFGAVGGLL